MPKGCHSQREEELLRGDTARSLGRTTLWVTAGRCGNYIHF